MDYMETFSRNISLAENAEVKANVIQKHLAVETANTLNQCLLFLVYITSFSTVLPEIYLRIRIHDVQWKRTKTDYQQNI
jgi:hypothetical protein